MEFTLLMPCLNEAGTLVQCINEAKQYIYSRGLDAEILIADNGSTDGSQDIAKKLGARVITVDQKGYGSALRTGIREAKGKYVIMGDSDLSYRFDRLDDFVAELRGGAKLVMGNRYKGKAEKGAMPFTHKYIGVPILSTLAAIRYHTKIYDYHCGLRAVEQSFFEKLPIRSTGMEFATEMIGAVAKHDGKIAEVPIDFRRDGRGRSSHLRSVRDGLRHMKIIFSPLIVNKEELM